jgi:hypothetical protein
LRVNGFRVFRVLGFGLRVQGSGFRVQGSGLFKPNLIDAPLPCRRGGRHAADDARRAPRTAAAAVVTESAM